MFYNFVSCSNNDLNYETIEFKLHNFGKKSMMNKIENGQRFFRKKIRFIIEFKLHDCGKKL